MFRVFAAACAAFILHVAPTAAISKESFAGSTYRFQGYDRNGVFISEGDLATKADGKAQFKFDFSTNPALQGRRLNGTWRVQNGRFCYAVRVNNRRVDACSRNTSASRMLWSDGSSTILTRISGPVAAKAAKPKTAPKTAAETGKAKLDRAERRRIQQALNAKGHNAGAPDGVFGARTAKAIAQWQRSTGAAATGSLTAAQAQQLLKSAPKQAVAAASCANPMTAAQHQKASELLQKIIARTDVRRKNAGKGKGLRLDRCRRVSYVPIGGKRRISGPLSSLYTGLNSSWHDVAKYGLIPKSGDYFISSYAALVSHSEPNAGQMGQWMKQVNQDTVAMLAAAGYPPTLGQKKRTVILNRDLDELGKPDLRVGFKALGDLMRRGSSGGSPASGKACKVKRSYTCRLPCANNSRPDPKTFPKTAISACTKHAASSYANANKLRLCKAKGYDRTRNLPPLDAYCE